MNINDFKKELYEKLNKYAVAWNRWFDINNVNYNHAVDICPLELYCTPIEDQTGITRVQQVWPRTSFIEKTIAQYMDYLDPYERGRFVEKILNFSSNESIKNTEIGMYTVENILDSRRMKTGWDVQYLIKWKHYELPTWELGFKLNPTPGVLILIDEFHQKNPNKPVHIF